MVNLAVANVFVVLGAIEIDKIEIT
jgi:hypothetical protein